MGVDRARGASRARTQKRFDLDDNALELIAMRFRILGERMRLKLLHALDDREMTVAQLVEATGAGQANVSKHLSVLATAGVVSRRKDGLNTYYRVADDTIFGLCEVVCSSLGEQLASHHDAIVRFKRR